MIQANMATAKVTIRNATRKHQSEENTAAITHKKQADRAMIPQKELTLNEVYFHCIKTSYSIHQNQSNSLYYSKYSNLITKQIYIYSTFVTLRNSLWSLVLGSFWQKTFVTLLAEKRCNFADF